MSSSKGKKLLTQNQMIQQISESTDVSKKQIKEIVNSIQEIVKRELNKNEVVRFFNIGKFKVAHSKARNGINPLTKKPLKIPARKRVKFLVAKSFTATVLGTSIAKTNKKTAISSSTSKTKTKKNKSSSKKIETKKTNKKSKK